MIKDKIKDEFKKIKSRYEKKYGALIFDVNIKNTNNGIILEGVVLTERQKKEVFLAAQKILKNIKAKNEIKVLGDPNEKLEIGWRRAEGSIIDIWSIFPGKKKSGNKDSAIYGERNQAIYGERSRATQAVKDDIVRILAKKRNYYLVQTQDLAIGWIEKSKIKNQKSKLQINKWKKIKRIKANKITDVNITNKTRKKFIAFLENYLYVPYVWGGTTELGIDCSGLVQKFYWEIFGILPPRHSADQAGYGEKASLGNAQFGDLVFLREKTKKYSHIGIIVEKCQMLNVKCQINFKAQMSNVGRKQACRANKNQNQADLLVLNARREKDGVVIENAEEILNDYKLLSIKRLIKIKK